ncbi:MAG: PfkB family carbohydrate kinase [Spirochaetes bacterium]|nr:PfkB family carbohydrate kinase [Spirochaetota bacterium]
MFQKKNIKIYIFGEIVLDLLLIKDDCILPVVGGSALNTLLTLKYFGRDPLFFSEIGNDFVGDLVLNFLNNKGLIIENIFRSEEIKTTISIVKFDENREAKYNFYKSYYKKPYLYDPIKKISFKKDDFVFLSSFFAGDNRNKKIIKYLIKKRKEIGFKLFYDPNIRLHHLKQNKVKLNQILDLLNSSDIIRFSFEDLLNIFRYFIFYRNNNKIFVKKLFFLIFKKEWKLIEKIKKLFNKNKDIFKEYLLRIIFNKDFYSKFKNYLENNRVDLIRKEFKNYLIQKIFDFYIKEAKVDFINKLIILTDGPYDIKVIFGKDIFSFEVPPIKPVSTVGAGDTFNGSVLNNILENYSFYENFFNNHNYNKIENNCINRQNIKNKIEELINFSIEQSKKVCLSNSNYPS